MARTFQRLTVTERRSIYVGFLTNEPKVHIARRLSIDHSTVSYHIGKVKHLTEMQIIALIRPESCCAHPSFKCICGTQHDNVKSEEFQEIRRLRGVVQELEKRLAPNDENTSHSTRSYPNPPIFSTRL